MDVTMTKRISILPAEIHDAGYHGEETPPEEEPTDGEDAAGTEGRPPPKHRRKRRFGRFRTPAVV